MLARTKNDKIVIAVADVDGPVSCDVCDATIVHHQCRVRVACNEESRRIAVCCACIAGGIAKMDEKLRERANDKREKLEARLEDIRKCTEEYATFLESLIGRLSVPSYDEYQADLVAKYDDELLAEDIYDMPEAERVVHGDYYAELEPLIDDIVQLSPAERVQHQKKRKRTRR
jgi:hypothetical protein